MSSTGHEDRPIDAVIIGAGLNGLTAATVLGRAKLNVLVLERRSTVGGLASGQEFHPGYRSTGLLHDSTGLFDHLNLAQYGLRRTSRPPSVLALGDESRGLLLHHDPREAAEELRATSADDVEPYVRFRSFIDQIKPFARRLFADPPPDWLAESHYDWPALLKTGIALRRLGKDVMYELLRLGPMSIADWLDDQFSSSVLKATLALPALHGSFGGPRSPGTCGLCLRYETLAGGAVIGGPQAIVDASIRAAEAVGVEIRTNCPVARITIDGGRVVGVICEDGIEVNAKLVLSSCDPKRTLLDLVGSCELSAAESQAIGGYRMRGLSAKVNLALSAPLRFRARPEFEVEYARIGASLDELERAFDAAKYGRFADEAILDIHVPTVGNPEAAPPGHASVSILIHGVPYDLDGGWTDVRREELGDAVCARLSRFAVDLDRSIVGRQVLTPSDIESEYGVTGGHVFHGEHGLDQLIVRPTRRCARYATPIDGLYLCGSGSHPGGGVTCLPGWISARTVLVRRR